MWPKVEGPQILPPTYKKCKNRPTSGGPSQPENTDVPEDGVPPQPQPQSAVSESGGPPQAQSAANDAGQTPNLVIRQIIKNKSGPSLPTNLVEANNMIQSLLNVAQEVISSNQYDWMKDEAKKLCAPIIVAGGDCEGGGTQESEVTTGKHGPLIQPQNSQK
ncbi:hypothetical protein SESBI_23959 [Sesbania bispinosa]|nr:hypothetical protein SESBI_23959 [Sesbania bispinosa]